VLELARADPALAETVSPESRDILAQVVYSAREEGARTLSDIILRRMHVGMTGARGLNQAQKIAGIAGRELKWSEDEERSHLEEFRTALDKDSACLKS
jgi:glycerol-3-phosphate dehydrogenase